MLLVTQVTCGLLRINQHDSNKIGNGLRNFGGNLSYVNCLHYSFNLSNPPPFSENWVTLFVLLKHKIIKLVIQIKENIFLPCLISPSLRPTSAGPALERGDTIYHFKLDPPHEWRNAFIKQNVEKIRQCQEDTNRPLSFRALSDATNLLAAQGSRNMCQQTRGDYRWYMDKTHCKTPVKQYTEAGYRPWDNSLW